MHSQKVCFFIFVFLKSRVMEEEIERDFSKHIFLQQPGLEQAAGRAWNIIGVSLSCDSGPTPWTIPCHLPGCGSRNLNGELSCQGLSLHSVQLCGCSAVPQCLPLGESVLEMQFQDPLLTSRVKSLGETGHLSAPQGTEGTLRNLSRQSSF